MTQPHIPEDAFQEWWRQLMPVLGWENYHTYRSAKSPSGFPDNVAIRLEPSPRLVFAELKTDDLKTSQPSIEQYEWLERLQTLGRLRVEAYLFRPGDRDIIEQIMK